MAPPTFDCSDGLKAKDGSLRSCSSTLQRVLEAVRPPSQLTSNTRRANISSPAVWRSRTNRLVHDDGFVDPPHSIAKVLHGSRDSTMNRETKSCRGCVVLAIPSLGHSRQARGPAAAARRATGGSLLAGPSETHQGPLSASASSFLLACIASVQRKERRA